MTIDERIAGTTKSSCAIDEVGHHGPIAARQRTAIEHRRDDKIRKRPLLFDSPQQREGKAPRIVGHSNHSPLSGRAPRTQSSNAICGFPAGCTTVGTIRPSDSIA